MFKRCGEILWRAAVNGTLANIHCKYTSVCTDCYLQTIKTNIDIKLNNGQNQILDKLYKTRFNLHQDENKNKPVGP